MFDRLEKRQTARRLLEDREAGRITAVTKATPPIQWITARTCTPAPA
jgi:hypothetical protein